MPIYIKYSLKKEIAELKEALLSRESILKRAYSQEEEVFSSQFTAYKEVLQNNHWQEIYMK